MDMIRLQMPLNHFAFLLSRKFMEYLPKVLAKLLIERLSTAFGYPYDMILAFPFRVA
jgi:hypothetical protein